MGVEVLVGLIVAVEVGSSGGLVDVEVGSRGGLVAVEVAVEVG
jgi:hypothetical protein